jgi:LysM repeat protein
MHRWFRFCALIALMAFSQGGLAQTPSEETSTAPIPKHRIKASPSDLVQFHMEAQGKKIDELKAQLEAQAQLIRAQTKLLEEIGQRSELQTKQIETLNGDLNRLNANLLSRNSEPAPGSTPVHTAEPVVVTPTSPVANPAGPATPAITPGAPTHVVKQGETLISIARQHGLTVSELLKVNKIEDERKLQIGQTLLLPPPPKKTDSQ